MAHPHASLIDALGGSSSLGRALGVPHNHVGNWRKRGISWPYRAAVARIAHEKGVALPDGFLGPTPADLVPTEAA